MTLIKNNLTFDALVRPQHLKNLYVFAKKYNNLPIVIDHIAKPKILVKEVRLKINGIPQQKKCVRQLNSKKYEDKNLIMSY